MELDSLNIMIFFTAVVHKTLASGRNDTSVMSLESYCEVRLEVGEGGEIRFFTVSRHS